MPRSRKSTGTVQITHDPFHPPYQYAVPVLHSPQGRPRACKITPDFDERAVQQGIEATKRLKALKVNEYGYQVVGGVLRR